MSSHVTTEKPEQEPLPDTWRSPRETAPSLVQASDPTLARVLGLIGLLLLTLGGVVVVASALNRAPLIPPLLGGLCAIVGLALLLFHAAVDSDLQVRRTYGLLGYLALAAAIFVTALPIRGPAGTQFLPWGFVFLALAFLFLVLFALHETDPGWRRVTLAALGAVGAALALTGFVGGNLSENFLLTYTLLLTVLGLGYLGAFVGLQGTSTELGYRAGLVVGGAGLLVFLVALIRSLLPPLLHKWHAGWQPEPFLVPSGVLLMAAGLAYAGLAAGLCSESHVAVLTRRELAAFFYSPIAYIVLCSLTVVAWLVFWQFVHFLLPQPGSFETTQPRMEPVIFNYFIGWGPVISTMFVVPVLTMRLLSEEHRTGTLEVLFTAPVTEPAVVLSKFLGTLIFFLLAWVPWGLFLLALWMPVIGAGQPFEWRPLLSFFIALSVSGAAFISMGLFFSSLTRNQIAAAILTFAGMLALFGVFIAKRILEAIHSDSNWVPILNHVSYVDLWWTSMEGNLTPRHLVFFASAAVFGLFATVKVLESRKWR